MSDNKIYETMLLPISGHVNEASLLALADQKVAVFHGIVASDETSIQMKVSSDRGRSWSETEPIRSVAGDEIPGYRMSPIRLKSGAIGILYTGPRTRPGRDGTLLFRRSDDEGRHWSEPVAVDPYFAVLNNDNARVLRNGRIIAPVFIWVSPLAGGDSEMEDNNLCYSWVYFSDDEGRSWKRSLSELIVAKDKGRGGIYHFVEPVVEELKDGRLLMYGRTELSRQYVSISEDGGEIWSTPQPGNLASAFTRSQLRRIPKTGDLLIIWNQASREEVLAGLSRHRLSCAISKDDGVSWEHYQNLESLDDVSQVEPAPAEPIEVTRAEVDGYRQPTDLKRYHRAPGSIRICYASVAFIEDEVLVAYDYSNNDSSAHGTKLRTLPLDWFYGITSLRSSSARCTGIPT